MLAAAVVPPARETDFGRILIGKTSKSALRPAEGRPEGRLCKVAFDWPDTEARDHLRITICRQGLNKDSGRATVHGGVGTHVTNAPPRHRQAGLAGCRS